MHIREWLWKWCPRPKKRVSIAPFTRLAMPLYVSVLIGGLLLAMGAAIILLPPLMFFSNVEESGRVTEVVERTLFPGGAIVVYKNPVYDPGPTWRISIELHNYITCEEDLSVYVNSRTNALNELLRSLGQDEKVWLTVTFKDPMEPTEFKDLYENYLSEDSKLDQSAIIVENEKSGKLETIVINAPSPDYLEEFTTYPKEGLKTIGVVSFDALVKADVADAFKLDPRTLLVDPQECLTIRALVRKYGLKGFKVTVGRPPILVKVFTPEETFSLVNMGELLDDPSKYDRWRLYLAGKVGDLDLVEDSFFRLNEELSVCYKYYEIDLSEQIALEDIKNGDYVIVVGTFLQKDRFILYADRIEKVKQDYPSALTVDQLLSNATDYDRQSVQVFGRVSDLGDLEGPFFRLDGKIMVSYIHDDIDLRLQMSEVQNGDPMVVTGTFYYDEMTLYARNIRPSK